MTAAPGKHVVVVDGSNLATEGRTTPSLRQLDEAVRAYAQEDPGADIVVVVDASFEHRIDPSERQQLIDAELHGEIVSPPAGAIGRGDAFVLRIAERTGARVLSNDSFQEFHAEHPWLFDTARLVGGKPVPGVGWIFTPRVPVRGPKSRQAEGKAKRKEAGVLSPPVKAAELAKAAKKVAARTAPAAVLPDGSKPKVGDVWAPAAPAHKEMAARGAKKQGAKKQGAKKQGAKKQGAKKQKAAPADGEAAGRKKAAKNAVVKAAGSTKKATKEVPAPSAKKLPKKATVPEAKATVPEAKAKKQSAGKKPAGKAEVAGKKEAAAKKPAAKAAAKKTAARQPDLVAREAAAVPSGANGAATAKSARRTAAKNPAVQEAIGHALAEAFSPELGVSEDGRSGRGDEKRKKQDGKAGRQRRRGSASPPPAVNEPFAFITFVATYPLDSELDGEVVSFTSHGAMVDVDLPGGGVLHSYIPLTALGDPPPTKARQVLTRGERRPFVLVALDPPRRVAELALPELSAARAQPGR